MEDRISASQAREKLADIINEVAFGGRRVVLHRHGKDIVAVVSASDLALLEALEDQVDLAAARAALKEKGERVKWKDLRKELKV